MPSSGSARVISAHRRSGRIDAALLASSGARCFAPGRHDTRGAIGECGIACRFAQRGQQLRQRGLWITHQAQGAWIAAAQFQRIDVDLHHFGVQRRNAPGVRHLIAGVAADEQHEVGLVHDLVGRRRGIVSGATNRQAMPRRDHTAPTKGGADRRRQRLAKPQHLRSGVRRSRARARDNNDTAGGAKPGGGAFDLVIRRRRPIRRHGQLECRVGNRRLAHRAQLDDIRRASIEIKMRGTR